MEAREETQSLWTHPGVWSFGRGERSDPWRVNGFLEEWGVVVRVGCKVVGRFTFTVIARRSTTRAYSVVCHT